MKIGRNDPCPCGSGKKYKKCCLHKDDAAARQMVRQREAARDAGTSSVETGSAAVPPIPAPDLPVPDPPMLSPEEAARDALWDRLDAADTTAIPDLFHGALAEAILDYETAMEMLSRLRNAGEYALYTTLLAELRSVQPDIYADGLPIYLEWQIADELTAGRGERLPELAADLADMAGDDLDGFYHSYDRLAYHGHLALIADTMARAWPHVRTSQTTFVRAIEHFATDAQLFTLLAYIERTDAPHADDPALLVALEHFAPVPDMTMLADQMALLTGQVDQPWDHAAGVEDVQLARLSFRFLADVAHEQMVPLSRAALARAALIDYLALRRDRSAPLAPRSKKAKGKGKVQHQPAVPDLADLLCPDRASMDRYVASRLNFLGFRPFEAAAMLELTPAWLAFLQRQNLITLDQQAEALRSLSKLVQDAEPIWAGYAIDAALSPNIQAAWQRATPE